ncbi:hypothetical protein [Streptomyces sp. NPDC051016]|uniref:hypothetical protein n=1 Tax=Streptomyces sp. NPDC051016 TaxID=3365638 RepID=UPI00378AF699
MARPESPLSCPPQRYALARHLREVRSVAGVTYAEMAEHFGGLPPATMKRIASDSGNVPKWSRVLRYFLICMDLASPEGSALIRATEDSLRKFWIAARMEERKVLHLPSPRPEFVHDKGDLSHALYSLYEHRGAPPLRDLQTQGGGAALLPLSTAARIVNRQALPVDTQQFKAFVKGCGVSEENVKPWLDAWYKVILSKENRQLNARQAMKMMEELAREVFEDEEAAKAS